MNSEKIGQFIAELRKANQMTQRELAAKLNITDKAVSKWERGLSMPDISLLPALSGLLGVSVSELLGGQRDSAAAPQIGESVTNALRYADRAVQTKTKSVRRVLGLVLTALLLTGMAVCVICDLAISGGLGWSLIPVASCAFGWLVLFPVIRFDKRGLQIGAINLSVAVFVYLAVLELLIGTGGWIVRLGFPVAALSVGFLWLAAGLFRWLNRRKLLAAAITLLLTCPFWLVLNAVIVSLVGGPSVDSWDILGMLVVLLGAIGFAIADLRNLSKKRF